MFKDVGWFCKDLTQKAKEIIVFPCNLGGLVGGRGLLLLLVVVEGVGQHGGSWDSCAPNGCCKCPHGSPSNPFANHRSVITVYVYAPQSPHPPLGSRFNCVLIDTGWGENIIGQTSHPITLSDPSKLVLSPHVFGHGVHPYFSAAEFPMNMPDVWDKHWGRLPSVTGTAIILGEWGGLFRATTWNGQERVATRAWQEALMSYIVQREVGFCD